jgi:mono/diheme cytochrome c family protein
MKGKYVYLIFTVFIVACAVQPSSKIKSLAGSSEEYQTYIKKEFTRGEVLYKKYCASCHGIFGPGNTDAPNFTNIQLHNYNAAFIRSDKENHAVEQCLDDESFQSIMTFLSYRLP